MSVTITRSTDAATITPHLVVGPYRADDEAQSLVHDILGATFPDVTLRPAHSAGGTMQILFLTPEAGEAARLFHRPAATFSITGSHLMLPGRYVPQGSIGRAQQGIAGLWVLDIGFRELAP